MAYINVDPANDTVSWNDALRFVNEHAADKRNNLLTDFLQSDYAKLRGERIDIGELAAWVDENQMAQDAFLYESRQDQLTESGY